MKTTTIAKKALLFGSSLLVVSSMFLTTSCGKKDDDGTNPVDTTDNTINDGFTLLEGTEISGEITKNTKLDATKVYSLAGGVHVKNGATLKIPAGTVIKSNPDEAIAYLLIEQGAKIDAQGTAESPIVFTSGSATPQRGDWGGIIICGKAPINPGATATAEVGNATYGGTVSDDNSGVLKYVRVEYTGNSINEEKEHNGFTFNGVGSGTTVEYLQAYMGNDDGFEFFGGTVKANYLVSTGSKDDSFDWTYGWVGGGSYWYGEQANDVGDRGIEADNNDKNHTASPYSNPTLTNITVIGNKIGGTGKDGVRLRVGTKANISNILVNNFAGPGINISDTVTAKHVNAGDLKIAKAKIENTSPEFKYDSKVNEDKKLTNDNTATGAGTSWTSASWIKQIPSDKKVTISAAVVEAK